MPSLTAVPGRAQTHLNQKEIAELRAATRQVTEAERAWAATVRRLGIAAVARKVGLTSEGLRQQVVRAERRRG